MKIHIISPLSNRYESLFKSAEERVYPNQWGRSKHMISVCISRSEIKFHWFPVMERLKIAGICPDGSNANISIVDFDELIIGFIT